VILAKTEKGRASLSDRRAFVRRERQLLVLADGRRDKDELAGLLGGDIEELVARMVFDGYLVRVAPSARNTAGSDHTAARAARPVSPAEKAQAPARPLNSGLAESQAPSSRFVDSRAPAASGGDAGSAAAGATAAPKPRRSLAASKMYVIGLMQMLRDPEASALAAAMHGAQDASELRYWVVRCLVFIHAGSGPDYAARVTARVLEVFPQEELPSLCDDLMQAQLPGIGALALEQRAALQGESLVA